MYHRLQALAMEGGRTARVLCLWVLSGVYPPSYSKFPFVSLLLTSMEDCILGLHHLTALASNP